MTASVAKITKEKHQYTYLQAAKETFLPFQWKNQSKIAEFLSGHKNAALAEVNANSRILSLLPNGRSRMFAPQYHSWPSTYTAAENSLWWLPWPKKKKKQSQWLNPWPRLFVSLRQKAANVRNSIELTFRTQLSTIELLLVQCQQCAHVSVLNLLCCQKRLDQLKILARKDRNDGVLVS